ncbi:Nephrocystin-3 [Tolypocladium ophioglossoides CBS 100239]|uniref:Nephrocystin-3 n=1 Tax=Tolypocladium ophioglossoides (strain CBS 100239) TaxID=1163406 RepID=A0A0L0NCP3_TOLOC|nr:Nephrocystin-3 [Tolypocladium ophioglossoides CBS 100239]
MEDALGPLRGLLHRVRGAVSRQRSSEISGLRVVRDPSDAEIDIVAVHGLGGQGFRSWITWDPKAGKPKSWLEELLAADVPSARIMTYGYISDGVSYRYIVRNIVYGRALDLAKVLATQRQRDGTNRRPLFFIAHSLGGWIVKRALIISSEAAGPELKDVELSTCGVAFFGTLSPGRPSSPSPLAHVIRRTTSGLRDDSRSQKAFPMQPHASDMEWLESQMEAFKAITANLPRLSFYETKKSQDGFIVEQRHSIAGSDGSQIGLKAAHSDLITFQGRDANYRTFIGNFREMVGKARSSGLLESKRKVFDLATGKSLQSLEYLTAGFSIPYKLPPEPGHLVTRQDLLDSLDAILNPEADPLTLHLGIANLWGLEGTGKSTLARHYAEINKSKLSFVFWIRAESWETVVASYLEFATALVTHYSKDATRSQVENDLGLTGVEDMLKVKSVMQLDTLRVKSIVRAVRDWLLRPDNGSWLLVFDNVEPSYDIFDFIPLTLSGKIILTSRDSNCCSWGTRLHVDAMKEKEAIELLDAVLGGTVLNRPVQGMLDAVASTELEETDGPSEEAASRAVEQLEYHPQNIALAASTMRNKGLTVFDYQSKVEAKMPLTLLGSTIHQSPVTRTILRISAMLSASMIPVTLFSASSHLKTVPARFTNIFAEMKAYQDLDHLDDVLQYLLDQNFIQTPSSEPSSSAYSTPSSSPSTQSSTSFDTFVVDPVARNHVRQTLTSDEKVEHAWLACNVCVDGIREKESDSSTLHEIHGFGRIMAPHAKTCYDDWSGVLEGPEDEDVAWHVLGNVCMTQGATDQAIGCFELSLRQNSNMDAIERIQTSLSLATLLQQAGQHKRSGEVLSEIDVASIDTAMGFRVALAKASAAAAQGELGYAEDQYESLEVEQEQALGPTDIATVGTVQALASTLEKLGKLEEAQALYRRVYISYQNIFGQSHPMTLEALESLASISKDAFAIDEAEALYQQSVDIKTRTLGADHPSTAHAIQNLAVIDDLRSRYPAARDKYQRALAIIAPSLGRAHPLYTTTMENLALSSRWHGHSLPPSPEPSPSSPRASAFREAERLYLDVLQIKKSARELYDEDEVLATGSKLCEMYENEGFFAEGRPERVDSLKGLLRRGTV